MMKHKDVLEYDYIGIDTIEDLLVEFDEMGFAPTATMPNAEEYAKKWKKKISLNLERRPNQGFRAI